MKEEYKSVSDKKIRSFFYRYGFYRMFRWLFIGIFLMVICVVWAIYVYYNKPKRKYYAITQYGIVQELIPEKKLL